MVPRLSPDVPIDPDSPGLSSQEALIDAHRTFVMSMSHESCEHQMRYVPSGHYTLRT